MSIHTVRARRTTIRGLFTAAAVALLVSATASSAAGGHQAAVTGTWSTTSAQVVEQQQLGPLLHLRQEGTAEFAGALAGTTGFDLHAFLRADYSSIGWAIEFFTGTWQGRSGTLLLVETATGGADGSVRIEATVVNGTGGLAGVHGKLTFVSDLCIPETCAGTYAGTLKG